ncbi:uncharacterized protein BP5553_02057 [Venustampulla echinocandica]|uniref:Aminoglycoside phosphotransferase domain-containing protein n=1 Tax=Venustampulla echinocandica TaxID=2656787 RepID=A0A370U2R8_9HELO|nr:uncharacterized protein BP5553_02057 [Venustampulla echinocandica]RDL42078.1 hypothetical protein BP5553_02057 [Venustampulla echinocandica]
MTDNKLHRARNGLLIDIMEQDCFDQKSILSQVLYPKLDKAPVAIDHGNLSPQNIIVDSELNITGIIDWGFAAKVLIQMACGFPLFLRLKPPSCHQTQPFRKIESLLLHPSSFSLRKQYPGCYLPNPLNMLISGFSFLSR